MATKKKGPVEVGPKVTKTFVRDGVIVRESIHIELTDNDDGTAIMAAFKQMAVFQSPAERIAVHRAAAQAVIDSGATGSRLEYAKNAVLYFEWSLGYLTKIVDPKSLKHAQDAIVDLIRAFEAQWCMDVKEVEPEIITGAKQRRSNKRGNIAKAATAQEKYKKLQIAADIIWAANRNLTKSRVAKLVAKKLDIVPSETIRKHIIKPT